MLKWRGQFLEVQLNFIVWSFGLSFGYDKACKKKQMWQFV